MPSLEMIDIVDMPADNDHKGDTVDEKIPAATTQPLHAESSKTVGAIATKVKSNSSLKKKKHLSEAVQSPSTKSNLSKSRQLTLGSFFGAADSNAQSNKPNSSKKKDHPKETAETLAPCSSSHKASARTRNAAQSSTKNGAATSALTAQEQQRRQSLRDIVIGKRSCALETPLNDVKSGDIQDISSLQGAAQVAMDSPTTAATVCQLSYGEVQRNQATTNMMVDEEVHTVDASNAVTPHMHSWTPVLSPPVVSAENNESLHELSTKTAVHDEVVTTNVDSTIYTDTAVVDTSHTAMSAAADVSRNNATVSPSPTRPLVPDLTTCPTKKRKRSKKQPTPRISLSPVPSGTQETIAEEHAVATVNSTVKKGGKSKKKRMELMASTTEVPLANDSAQSANETTAIDGIVSCISILPNAELDKILSFRQAYRQRFQDLLLCCKNGLPEEQSTLSIEPLPTHSPENEHSTAPIFPDFAITTLVSVIEGQSLPLDDLSSLAKDVLNGPIPCNGDTDGDNDADKERIASSTFDVATIAPKIQLLAIRKHFVKNIGATDIFDEATTILLNDERMYRWEVVIPSVDSYTVFFPNSINRTNVKKARTARKKISAYLTALAKALNLLQEAEQIISQTGTLVSNDSEKKQRDKAMSRVDNEIEKILKFEREHEANRLAEVARNEKQKADRLQKELMLQKKQEASIAKLKEKEMKQQQIAEAKLAAQKAAKDATTVKTLEQKEKQQPKQINIKQKQCMMSFLAKRTSSIIVPTSSENTPPICAQTTHPNRDSFVPALTLQPSLHANSLPQNETFDVQLFRSAINDTPSLVLTDTFPKQQLSRRARQSRRRRTQLIAVPVFVTIYPDGYQQDNPFAAQPYAEQMHVNIFNKYKFLSFYEDVRPPYYGTWTKTSKRITGRKPFSTDTKQLDYDIDSEGDWEEGDDDVGEDLGDDGIDDNDEEKDIDDDDDEDDGWLAADDDVDDEDDGDDLDEAKILREKKGVPSLKREALTVCIVAPYAGRPLPRMAPDSHICFGRIEGLNPSDAFEFLETFATIQLSDSNTSIHAYPPALVDEVEVSSVPHSEKSPCIPEANMKTFATFVHNCTLGSKDKVIDELFQVHVDLNCSRAQAFRLLDSIAEKKKHPCNGSYFWEVKKPVLEGLGLAKLAESTAIAVEDVKQEALKTIVRFVHNSTIASKEKIVDDLRASHESVTASRAEAMRIVQSIAVKEKHPSGGYYWIVKEAVREKLDLLDLPSEPPLVVSLNPSKDFSKEKKESVDTTGGMKRKSATSVSKASVEHISTVQTVTSEPKDKYKSPTTVNSNASMEALANFIKKQKLS